MVGKQTNNRLSDKRPVFTEQVTRAARLCSGRNVDKASLQRAEDANNVLRNEKKNPVAFQVGAWMIN